MNVEKGYVDEPIEEGIDLREEILRLKKERNAVIMAHYYQREEIQQLADYIGDSLALAQLAAKTDAPVIILCGVHFMGETAKILCPDKTVIVPDLSAGCSLADSCPADEFAKFVGEHPDHTVISYVNTSAAVKAVTDVVVTSSNAKEIVGSLPEDGTCACNECEYMKLITLEKLYNSLKFMAPAIEVDAEIAERAVKPIQRMLDISRDLGIIK